jgi:acyl carrier protein
MTRHDALRLLEETLEMKPNTLLGPECLRDLELWDSLSTMTFIAMVDKRFGLPLPGSRVVRCQTVNELIDLIKPHFSQRAA